MRWSENIWEKEEFTRTERNEKVIEIIKTTLLKRNVKKRIKGNNKLEIYVSKSKVTSDSKDGVCGNESKH